MLTLPPCIKKMRVLPLPLMVTPWPFMLTSSPIYRRPPKLYDVALADNAMVFPAIGVKSTVPPGHTSASAARSVPGPLSALLDT